MLAKGLDGSEAAEGVVVHGGQLGQHVASLGVGVDIAGNGPHRVGNVGSRLRGKGGQQRRARLEGGSHAGVRPQGLREARERAACASNKALSK